MQQPPVRARRVTPLEEISYVATHLEVDARLHRKAGTVRIAVKTLDAHALRLRRALKELMPADEEKA